jgi:DNA-binding MarR family transcriptional regulator
MHRRKTHGKTRDILVLKIAHPEMTNTDIARLLNVTRRNVVKALRVCV